MSWSAKQQTDLIEHPSFDILATGRAPLHLCTLACACAWFGLGNESFGKHFLISFQWFAKQTSITSKLKCQKG